MNQNKNHGQDIIINLQRTLVYKKDKFLLVISEHLPIIKDQLKFVSYKTMPSKELMNGLQYYIRYN